MPLNSIRLLPACAVSFKFFCCQADSSPDDENTTSPFQRTSMPSLLERPARFAKSKLTAITSPCARLARS
ncbi:Uncharacterised protein [Vibrio cholerae]|nr:Uncharacterised protein [Vibrio cholerae]